MPSNQPFRRPILFTLAFGLLFALPGLASAQTVLATTRTSSTGSFDAEVTIPSTTAPGTYDVTATGEALVTTSYPPNSSNVTLSKTTVAAGETIRVSGAGWSPSTLVTLRLELVRLSEASFTLAQATEMRTVRARVHVVAPAANAKSGAAAPQTASAKILSRTGMTALPLLAAGLGTILLGAVLVNAGRRRHRENASSL